ncbi:MAG: four helix bundle protein [Chloroflexia bacterium]
MSNQEEIKGYKRWEETVSSHIKADSVWRVEAYRLSLFAGELGWHDTEKLIANHHMRGVADQLYRALGSISANIAEGYSRGTSKDRAHFYEYALGSARESLTWYHHTKHILSEQALNHRMELLTQIIRLLLVMVPQQRGRTIREDGVDYTPDSTQ